MSGRHRAGTGTPREPLGRPFRWLWAGQTGSSLGSAAQSLALPLWVLQVTHSAGLTGAAFAVQLVPRFLFSPFAGVIVDRCDRRNLFIVLNLLAATITAGLLVVVRTNNVPLYYVLSTLLGTLSAVSATVLPSLVPALVPASRLTAATATQEMTNGVILAVGPLLGATVAVGLGFFGAVAVNAASFLLAALMAAPIPRQSSPPGRRRPPRVMLREGLSALVGDRVLRTAVLAEGLLFLFLGALPQFALILFGNGGHTAHAGLFSSGMGTGWLMTSAVLARRRDNLDPTRMLVAGAALAAPVAGAVVLGQHASAPWVFATGLLAGTHNLLFAMAPGLLCQRRAAAAVLGRVIAFRRSVLVLSQCLSIVLATVLSPRIGVGPFLAGAGVAATVTALPVARLALRRAARPGLSRPVGRHRQRHHARPPVTVTA